MKKKKKEVFLKSFFKNLDSTTNLSYQKISNNYICYNNKKLRLSCKNKLNPNIFFKFLDLDKIRFIDLIVVWPDFI